MNLSAIYIILMIKKYRTYRMWTYFMSIFLIIMLLVFLPQSKQRIIDQTIKDFTGGVELNIFSKDLDKIESKKIYFFLKLIMNYI